jgi:hypothetical protein
METLLVQAASLAGVGLLVGLAWAFGFRQSSKLDGEAAVRALAAAEGETLETVLVDQRGRAALGKTTSGALFAAKIVGGDVAVRIMPFSEARLRRTKGGVRARFPGLAWDDVTLVLDADARRDWIGGLQSES